MFKKILYSIILFFIIIQLATANELTLKQKIAQMLIIGFKGKSLQDNDPIVKAIMLQQIGGVILFDYDYQTKTFDHNIESPEQLKELTSQLQSYNLKSAKLNGNALYPLLISIDYEGGNVNRLNEKYGFPHTLSAAQIGKGTVEQAQKYAEQMADTLKDEGINMNFAPVLDVNVNPDNPIIGKLERSFSADPNQVSLYAGIFAKAYKDKGILCSYKHFPGHGSSTTDSHLGFVDVTQTWQPYELDPYKTLFASPNSCPIVMTSHVVNYNLDKDGYPASLSYAMTQKLLREELKFKGVVVTDDLQMKAVTDYYGLETAVRLSINAGADLLVFGNQLVQVPEDPKNLVDMIYTDVKNGKIPEERINNAYFHVMLLKKWLKEQHNNQLN